jgi:two-component system LytT family response regulator
MNALIVEDITLDRDSLKNSLRTSNPEITIVGEATNESQAYQLIQTNKPDLVFLDIDLAGGGSSFNLLQKLHAEGPIHFKIIFITGFGSDENTSKAIDYSALAFITKPFDKSELRFAIRKALHEINKNEVNLHVNNLLENLTSPEKKMSKLAVHRPKGIYEFIDIDEILYCKADKEITILQLIDGEKITAVKNLKQYDRQLTWQHNFFRINHNLVINLDYVRRFNPTEKALKLKNGETVFASVTGNRRLKRYLEEFGGKYQKLQTHELYLVEVLRKLIGRLR